MGNSFWILFAALNNLKPLNLTIAEVNVFSYSLCETVCPLHYGVINRHWALDVTEKCLRVVWSHVLFPPRKCNTRCANLFFAPGNLQNRTWAPNWNRALKPTTEERPSGFVPPPDGSVTAFAAPKQRSSLFSTSAINSPGGSGAGMSGALKGIYVAILSLFSSFIFYGFVPL